MRHTPRPIEEWEREYIRKAFMIADQNNERPDTIAIGLVVKRTPEMVKHIGYQMGYTLSGGKFTMVDKQRDNEYMKNHMREIGGTQ
jgi:hypothetical protein